MAASLTTKQSMKTEVSNNKESNKGAWTAEEDAKLAEIVAIHGAKRWKMIATKAGLNRCGKSCRMRWLNYLRPNIKRGNISDQEEDLIIRLHKLLGNRWSLIAGRLPGRTDNEIKNYWNSHLSKKINKKERLQKGASSVLAEESKNEKMTENMVEMIREEEEKNSSSNSSNNNSNGDNQDSISSFNVDDFFDFSNEDPLNLEWMSQFLETNDL